MLRILGVPFACGLLIFSSFLPAAFATPWPDVGDDLLAAHRARLQELQRKLDESDYEGARVLARAALATLVADARRLDPADAARAAWDLGTVAERTFDLATTRAALTLAEATLSPLVPSGHRDLRNLRTQLAMIELQLLDHASAAQRGPEVLDGWPDPAPGEEADFLRARYTFLCARTDPEGLAMARRGIVAALERTEPVLGPMHFDVLTARHCLAITCNAQRDLESALVLEQQAFDGFVRTLPADHPYVLYARGALGYLLSQTPDLARARAMLEDELATDEAILPWDHPQLAWTRMNLALVLDRCGELPAETILFEKVLAARERTLGDDDLNLAWTRGNLAACYRSLGRPREALALEEKVLATRTRVLHPDDPDLRTARLNLAVTLVLLGDVQRAMVQLTAVLDATPAFDASILSSVLRQSDALMEQGYLVEARTLQQRLLAASEDEARSQPALLASARTSLACTLHELGDLDGTQALLQAAVDDLDCLPADDASLGILVQFNLASVMAERRELAAARSLLEDLVHACEAQPIATMAYLPACRVSLAQALIELGELDEAQALLTVVLDQFRASGVVGHPLEVHAREQMAELRLVEGDLPAARELLEQALAMDEALVAPGHGDTCDTLEKLVRIAWRLDDRPALQSLEGRVVDALEHGLESTLLLPPRTAAAQMRRMRTAIDAILSLSTRSDERLFGVIETGRALAVALAGARSRADPVLRDLLSGAGDVRRTIQSQARLAGTHGDDIRLARLVLRRDELEGQARERMAQSDALQPRVDAGAVARALGNGERAVSFITYTRLVTDAPAPGSLRSVPTLAAFVVDADATLQRIDLAPSVDVAAAVHDWRTAIGEPLEARGRGKTIQPRAVASEKASGERLRALVLDPVLAVLGDARDLRVCLDDVLHLLPLDALPLEDGLVGDRYRIRLLNDLSSGCSEPPASDNVRAGALVAVGGVDYDADPGRSSPRGLEASAPPVDLADVDPTRSGAAGWAPLPGALRESEFVGECFQRRFGVAPIVLTGEAATKGQLESALHGARWVHIATHGWFGSAGSPEERGAAITTAGRQPLDADLVSGMAPMALCGLALAGANRAADAAGRCEGIMTAEELAGLDLSGCELAVLSACETNVGRRSTRLGIQSLQAALHAAGVHHAITSLWRVDDDASRALFEEFYARVWSQDEAIDSALWHAKRSLRDQGRPVRDWAGWVLTGGLDR